MWSALWCIAYPTTLPSSQCFSAIGNQLCVYSFTRGLSWWFGTRWYFLLSRATWEWLKTIYLPHLDGLMLNIANFLGTAIPHSMVKSPFGKLKSCEINISELLNPCSSWQLVAKAAGSRWERPATPLRRVQAKVREPLGINSSHRAVEVLKGHQGFC